MNIIVPTERACFMIAVFLTLIVGICAKQYYPTSVREKDRCPPFDDGDWRENVRLYNCTFPYAYHCALDDTDNFIDACAIPKFCGPGKRPVLLEHKIEHITIVSCGDCQKDSYTYDNKSSANMTRCPYPMTDCERRGWKSCNHKDSSPPFVKDRLCRCDAREGYRPFGRHKLEIGGCFRSEGFVDCWHDDRDPCPKDKDRLLNYTCSPKCKLFTYRLPDSDECLPLPNMPTSTTHEPTDTTTPPQTTATSSSKPDVETTTIKPYSGKSLLTGLTVGSVLLLVIIVAIITLVYKCGWCRCGQQEINEPVLPETINLLLQHDGRSVPNQPQPVAPQPVAPQPPAVPQPVAPQPPAVPQPVAPQPPAVPQPVAPQPPAVPQPVAPQPPAVPQPVAPQPPAVPQPVAPQPPAVPQPVAPQPPAVPQPVAPQPPAVPQPVAPQPPAVPQPVAPQPPAVPQPVAPQPPAVPQPVAPQPPAVPQPVAPQPPAVPQPVAPQPPAVPQPVAPQPPAVPQPVAPPPAAPQPEQDKKRQEFIKGSKSLHEKLNKINEKIPNTRPSADLSEIRLQIQHLREYMGELQTVKSTCESVQKTGKDFIDCAANKQDTAVKDVERQISVLTDLYKTINKTAKVQKQKLLDMEKDAMRFWKEFERLKKKLTELLAKLSHLLIEDLKLLTSDMNLVVAPISLWKQSGQLLMESTSPNRVMEAVKEVENLHRAIWMGIEKTIVDKIHEMSSCLEDTEKNLDERPIVYDDRKNAEDLIVEHENMEKDIADKKTTVKLLKSIIKEATVSSLSSSMQELENRLRNIQGKSNSRRKKLEKLTEPVPECLITRNDQVRDVFQNAFAPLVELLTCDDVKRIYDCMNSESIISWLDYKEAKNIWEDRSKGPSESARSMLTTIMGKFVLKSYKIFRAIIFYEISSSAFDKLRASEKRISKQKPVKPEFGGYSDRTDDTEAGGDFGGRGATGGDEEYESGPLLSGEEQDDTNNGRNSASIS